MFRRLSLLVALAVFALVQAVPSLAQSKCDAGKLKEYGKRVSCLAKVESTAAKKGELADATKAEKCVQNFAEKCAKAEGEGDCTAAVNSCGGLATEAATCGERTVGCQDGDGLCPAGCGSGTDDDCTSCFADLGLTVRDTCQNLEWEKKDTPVGSGVDAANEGDVDNLYVWAGTCTISSASCQPNAAAAATCSEQTGGAPGCAECGGGADTCNVDPLAAGAITTIWDWVNQLNAASFAGHMDWRVPEIGELQTILDCGFSPCIDPIFGSTSGDYYWSGTNSNLFFGVSAWAAGFGNGDVNGAPAKGNEMHVRAVR